MAARLSFPRQRRVTRSRLCIYDDREGLRLYIDADVFMTGDAFIFMDQSISILYEYPLNLFIFIHY